MARNEQIINAPPEAVFDVLGDPRSYAYWVVGSMEIDADPDWPQRGSRFHHTVGMGPLRIKDQTVIEEVRPGRFLQIETKTRPLGSARVKLELEPLDGRTRVTMTEQPANKPTAFVFTPLTHLLIWGRNVPSLDRLAELSEGRRPIPGTEPGASERTTDGEGSVPNPKARARRQDGARGVLVATVRGAGAGLAGAAVMSVSTNLEMRLRGREPSYAPAKALGRVLGVNARGKQRQKLLGAAGHTATAVSLSITRGLLDRLGLGSRSAAVALFALAMTPEVAVVPALGASEPPWRWSAADAAVSAWHHGVFAATTSVVHDGLSKRD